VLDDRLSRLDYDLVRHRSRYDGGVAWREGLAGAAGDRPAAQFTGFGRLGAFIRAP
jgi:hypothetical protein